MSSMQATQPGKPQQPPIPGEGARALLTAAAAFIVLFGLKYTRDFAIPIVLAAFLAIVSYPLTESLRRYLRFPHWLAVAFSVLVDCGIIFIIVSIVRYLSADVVDTLKGNVTQLLQAKLESTVQWIDTRFGMGDQVREMLESPLSFFDPQYIISLSQSLTGRVISFLSITVLVLILMTFLLGEAPLFMRNFDRLPNSMQGKHKIISALRGVQRYLLIKTVASVCTGLLAWGLCHAIHVPFAFLWGFVACVLNFIPTIGSIIAAIPPILLTLALSDWSSVFIVSGGYMAINFAIGNGIEPLFLGKQFGIATSVVLLSVIIWGWVWGPIGMLLAVPITVLTKLALENSADLRWVSAIIDDKPSSAEHRPHTPQH